MQSVIGPSIRPALQPRVAFFVALFVATTTPTWAASPVLSLDNSNSALNTFFGGTDSNIYDVTESPGCQPFGGCLTYSWSQVTGVGGVPGMSQNSGMASYNNSIWNFPEIFYLSLVGGTQHILQVYGTSRTLGDLTQYETAVYGSGATQPPVSGSNVVGFVDGCAQSDNVFYIGTDQHVHLLRWTPSLGWEKTIDLTSISGSLPALGTSLTGHEMNESEEIFFTDTNRHVHELWEWSGCAGGPLPDGWHSVDVNQSSGNGANNVLAGSSLSGYYDSGNSSGSTIPWVDVVFYIDTQNHVQELYFSNTVAPISAWNHVDITAQSGAAAAASGSALTSFVFVQTIDPFALYNEAAITFLDASSNVWEATLAPTSSGSNLGWVATNLTKAVSGATAAEANSPLTAVFDTYTASSGCTPICWSDQVELNYVGVDQHIHQFDFANRNSKWTLADLTHNAGAPLSAP